MYLEHKLVFNIKTAEYFYSKSWGLMTCYLNSLNQKGTWVWDDLKENERLPSRFSRFRRIEGEELEFLKNLALKDAKLI